MTRLFFVFLMISMDRNQAQCHNRCSGHGTCDIHATCDCDNGYTGADCSLRVCPSGKAWFDVPTNDSMGHQVAECSNNGICNRETGLCVCRSGFEGSACQRMACPNDCSGNGECYSMRSAASSYDGVHLIRPSVAYNLWDADVIHGCICDEGYTGYDCSIRRCAHLDDPLTTRDRDQRVYLTCQCTQGSCNDTDSFKLKWKGKFTERIKPSDNNQSVQAILNDLTVSSPFSVAFQNDSSTICDTYPVTSILTLSPPLFGNGDELQIRRVTSPALSVYFETSYVLRCSCTSSCDATGFFAFALDGILSANIALNASSEMIMEALQDLKNSSGRLQGANITMDEVNNLCSSNTSTNVTIVLTSMRANIDGLYVISDVSTEPSLDLLTPFTARTERKECSGLGTCNEATATCSCYSPPDAYASTNGECQEYRGYISEFGGLQRCAGYVDTSYTTISVDSNVEQYAYTVLQQGNDSIVYQISVLDVDVEPIIELSRDTSVYAMVLDGIHDHLIYMEESSDGSFNIKRRDAYDNTTKGSVIIDGLSNATAGLAVDLSFDDYYLYYTQAGQEAVEDGEIYRASYRSNFTIENLTDNIYEHLNVTDPHGIALNLPEGRMCWVDSGVDGVDDGLLLCADLDGRNGQVIADFNLTDPVALTMDLYEHIYYVGDQSSIKQIYCDLNTTKVKTITNTSSDSDYVHVLRLSKDLNQLYWIEAESMAIMYAERSADGTWGSPIELYSFSTISNATLHPVLTFDFGEGPPADSSAEIFLACSGHGNCLNVDGNYRCDCYEGWTGGDCSEQTCPMGLAWFDEAYARNDAHTSIVECSAMGICDRSTGQCTCHSGFEGAACDRMTCPSTTTSVTCSGHGRCLSMSQTAAENGVSYEYNSNQRALWDADRIYGCICDNSYEAAAYHGYDCSLRTCPSGEDYRVDSNGTYEVQSLNCTDPSGVGHFVVSYRGARSMKIRADANVTGFASALEHLPTINAVIVTSEVAGTICEAGQFLRVTFIEPGDLPLMEVEESSSVASVTITEETQGSKDTYTCSNHGTCDESIGICTCFGTYTSSSTLDTRGSLGNCGYMDSVAQVVATDEQGESMG